MALTCAPGRSRNYLCEMQSLTDQRRLKAGVPIRASLPICRPGSSSDSWKMRADGCDSLPPHGTDDDATTNPRMTIGVILLGKQLVIILGSKWRTLGHLDHVFLGTGVRGHFSQGAPRQPKRSDTGPSENGSHRMWILTKSEDIHASQVQLRIFELAHDDATLIAVCWIRVWQASKASICAFLRCSEKLRISVLLHFWLFWRTLSRL